MTSTERGSLITIVFCMSAAGIFVPPMFIFPRKKLSDTVMRGAPVGSIGKPHPSGWIQAFLFTQWFQNFVENVKPTEAPPVLLILDGHYSHTKNIELIYLAEQHHVTILSLPRHCSHKVQPLDRTFMGSLKSYYSEDVRVFLSENERMCYLYDVVELFGKAYMKCQTQKLLQLVSKLVAYVHLIVILRKPMVSASFMVGAPQRHCTTFKHWCWHKYLAWLGLKGNYTDLSNDVAVKNDAMCFF